jgi:hypothetical protein
MPEMIIRPTMKFIYLGYAAGGADPPRRAEMPRQPNEGLAMASWREREHLRKVRRAGMTPGAGDARLPCRAERNSVSLDRRQQIG